jgi:hypothetical protein
LYHWIDVLNRFDEILEKAWKLTGSEEDECVNLCVGVTDEKTKELVVSVLKFSALLIEHSYARHVYNSMESLVTLLGSTDMDIIIAVLNLLYVFSKRSNFLVRLSSDQRHSLQLRLNHLAESWGGKENGFGLAQCCTDKPITEFPETATTLHLEFYQEGRDAKYSGPMSLCTVHLDHVEQLVESTTEIVRYLVMKYKVPKGKQMSLLSRIRLARYFPDYTKRVQCVQSRLQAIAVLVYSSAGSDVVSPLLYPGFTEELVELLQLNDDRLTEVRAAALRTLTAIIHLERSPKLNAIIDATGAANYHGFLPTVARNCVASMTDSSTDWYPLNFSTALFSFIYHLASLDAGAGALLSCGILETLLKVIDFRQQDQSHLTFVTRAVRIIDLITNSEMGALQAQNGLASLIARLKYDVDECRKVQPSELPSIPVGSSNTDQETAPMETETIYEEPAQEQQCIKQQPLQVEQQGGDNEQQPNDKTESCDQPGNMEMDKPVSTQMEEAGSSRDVYDVKHTCLPQRAALVKSILNFLKKCIPETAFAENIRTMMDSSLPSSLKHIISNSEFYGSALYYLATEVVTVYVFHEPSLLSALQDTGLTGVMLNSLIMKDIPSTRDVLGSLPNMLSALCLNSRGLEAFVNCKPFDRLFKVMLLPEYLPAMRKRRSTDDMDDTAANLGSAMDELMRQQPALKSDAMGGVVRLLQQLCELGRDPQCTVETQNEANRPDPIDQSSGGEGQGTVTDDEDDDDLTQHAVNSQRASPRPEAKQLEPSEKKAVPLLDYAHNVIRFLFSILNNNATDDHFREFVQKDGLDPLLSIPSLPNMPITFPISPACQSVAVTCRGLLSVAVQPEVFTQCIQRLTDILLKLNDAWSGHHTHGSVLLHELACSSNPAIALESAQMSPLLHCMVSAHSYINILSVLCKVTQSDIKTLMINHWTSRAGLALLDHLSTLCRSLIWECTVLLALCTPGHIPDDSDFGMDDIKKLVPEFDRKTSCLIIESTVPKETVKEDATAESSDSSSAMPPAAGAVLEQLIELESESTESPAGPVKQERSALNEKMAKLSPQLATIIKHIRPLLTVASRLGRSVSDIYAVLVRLFVIPQHQPRRYRHTPSPPKQPAWECVAALTKTLVDGFTWVPPDLAPTPGFRLTLLLCFAGLTSSMLFDEQKSSYHIMLKQFASLGGVDALLEAFNWAVDTGRMACVDSSSKASLYEDVGEFVDMWLFLMEQMVNVKTVLESPHSLLPSWKPPQKFDPLAFLVKTHKVAFSAVSTLWGRKPVREAGHMSEAVLQILSHILKGESQIRKKLEKQSSGDTSNDNSSAAAQPEVNESYLQMLSDMGFPESHCREALVNTSNNWERAVEYVLSHPPADFDAEFLGSLGVEMSEEEQMARAIALSLGDHSTEQEKETKQPEVEQKEDEIIYIEQTVLDNFTDQLLAGCLQLLDHVPKAVHSACDLITVAAKRNGKTWKKKVLADLFKELSTGVGKLVELGESCVGKLSSAVDENSQKEFIEGSLGSGIVTRLHLFALLFEESKLLCVQIVEETECVTQLITLVNLTAICLSNRKDTPTPKWLTFVVLLLDLYQSVASPYYIKRSIRKKVDRMWQWFDDRGHRWFNYTQANNTALNDMYNRNEPVARITTDRRRYVIDFRTMMQRNEDTGNIRPVMFVETPGNDPQEDQQADSPTAVETSGAQLESIFYDQDIVEESDKRTINGLSEQQQIMLIHAVAQLIGVPVDSEPLNAVLRLCLRLTRSHTCASVFTERNGPKHILNLKQASAFSGYASLITLIFRHILEDRPMLERTMESVVRSVALPGAGTSREVYSAFRKLGPAACRNPSLFTEVAMRLLRIAPSAKHQEETSTLPGRSQPFIQLKALSAPKKPVSHLSELQETAVKQLLDALCSNMEDFRIDLEEQRKQTVIPRDLIRQITDGMDEQEIDEEMDVQSETQPQQSDQDKKASDMDSVPLLSKATILRILAELVRCYPGCARLVTEYDGDDLSASESVLSYILDYLLIMPPSPTDSPSEISSTGSSDTASLARILLVTISAVQHSPDAHALLVNEVKAAFHRSLSMMECPTKHARIQALASLLSGMIEPSPPMGGTPAMTNVHKLLLRKGVLSDLARITHSLDLSSPSMANTINAVLKTLESLTFLVNSYTQKALQLGGKKSEKKATGEEQSDDTVNKTQSEPSGQSVSKQSVVPQTQTVADEIASQEVAVSASQTSQTSDIAGSQLLHEDDHFADLSTLSVPYDPDMEDAGANQDWDMSEVAATPQPQARDNEEESMSEDEVDDAEEVAEFEAVVGELLEGAARDSGQEHFVVEEPSSEEEDSSDEHEGSGSDGSQESNSSEDTMSGEESGGENQNEQQNAVPSPLSPTRDDEQEEAEVVVTVEAVTQSSDRHSDRGDDYDVHIVTELIDSPHPADDLDDVVGGVEEVEAHHINETMEAVDEEDEDMGDEIEDEDDEDEEEDEDDIGDEDEEGSEMEGDEEHLDETIYEGDMNLMDDDIPHSLEEMLMLVGDSVYGRPAVRQHMHTSVYASYDQDLYDAIGLTGPPESVPQQHPLLSRPGMTPPSAAAQLQQIRAITGYPLTRVGARHRGQLRRVSQQVNTLTQPPSLVTGNTQPHAQTRRLLGPAVAQSLFQLNQRGSSGRTVTHVTRTAPHVQVIPRPGVLSDAAAQLYISHARGTHFLTPFEFGPPRMPSNSSTIPSSLSRWTEESRLLDGEVAYKCLESCQKKVLSVLNIHKDEEERKHREEQHKANEELKKDEQQKMEQEQKKGVEASGIEIKFQPMETEQPYTSTMDVVVSGAGDLQPDVTEGDSQQKISNTESPHPKINHVQVVSSTPVSTEPEEMERDFSHIDEIEQLMTTNSQSESTAQSGAVEQEEHNRSACERGLHDIDQAQVVISGTPELRDIEQGESSGLTEPGPLEVQSNESLVNPAEMVTEASLDKGSNIDQNNTTVSMPETEQTTQVQLDQTEETTTTGQTTRAGNSVSQAPIAVGHTSPSISPVNGLSESVAALRPYSIGEPAQDPIVSAEESSLPPAISEAATAVVQSMTEFVAIAQGELSPQSSGQPTVSQPQALPSRVAPSEETIADISSRLHARCANQPGGVEAENMSIFLSALQSLTGTGQSSTTVTTSQSAESIAQASDLAASFIAAMSHGPSSPQATLQQTSGSESVGVSVSQSGSSRSHETTPHGPDVTDGTTAEEQQGEIQSQPREGTSNKAVPANSTEAEGTATSESSVLEGVDPSFLAALPEDLREEVVADQLRMQRARQVAEAQGESSGEQALAVNPEILANLPPNIQEEVLQQQRMLQARQAVQSRPPEMASDPAAFLQNLDVALRQSILAEMDDDTLSHLPAEITTEARELRTQRDARHAQIIHEQQLLSSASGMPASWSSFLRSSGLRRAGAFRHHHMEGYRPTHRSFMPIYGQAGSSSKPGVIPTDRRENEGLGKQLLDREALTCLLVLLFINDPKVHMSQLQRVIKNLCQHRETRTWIVSTLLSILTHTAAEQPPPCHPQILSTNQEAEVKRSIAEVSEPLNSQSGQGSEDNRAPARKAGSWLSLKVDATLGAKANVFQIERSSKSGIPTRITVHPHAVPVICHHVLDQLYCLVKFMPKCFMSQILVQTASEAERSMDHVTEPLTIESDFWDILVRLDGASGSRKGKGAAKTGVKAVVENSLISSSSDFGRSPLGRLIEMLSHPVVRRSQTLTDHLLKLLSTLSRNLPEINTSSVQKKQNVTPGADQQSEVQEQNQPAETQTREQQSGQGDRRTTETQSNAATTTGESTGTSEKIEPLKDISQFSRTALRIDPSLMSLVVDVLTMGLCSEEGLEDATTLLLQLSRQGAENRETGLDLMLRGTKELGLRVCQQVNCLLSQLSKYRKENPHKFKQVEETEGSGSSIISVAEQRRTMQDAALASISRSSKSTKKHMDLHLPAMSELTCKASTQKIFLRTLKVVLQLRDSARHVVKPSGRRSVSQLTSRMEQQRERLEELRETLEDVRRARGSSQHSSIDHLDQVQQALEELEAEAGTLASSLQGIDMMLDMTTPRELPSQQSGEGSNTVASSEAKNSAGMS